MNNILYSINSLIILPAAFILLFLYKENKSRYLIAGLAFLSIHSFINLFLYINIGVERNLDPVITNFILVVLFLFITSKITGEKDKLAGYHYLSRVILYGFGIYYFFEHIPFLRGIVTLIIAFPSVIFAKIMGSNCWISGIDYAGYNLFWQGKLSIIGENILEVNVPVTPTNIGIVLGCTGLREIILLYFLIRLTSAGTVLKKRIFLIDSLIIIIANVIRNTIVIYYTGYKNLSFEFTHHTVGSILILVALLFVVIFTLFKIPQINSYIEDIFNLKKIKY